MDASNQFALQGIKDTLESPRDNRYIRGSSIGLCARRIGYSLLGYQPLPTDGHSTYTLGFGNAAHDYLQQMLVRMGWVDSIPYWNEAKAMIDWKPGVDTLSGCELDVIDHNLRVLGHLDAITVPLITRVTNGKTSYHPDPNGERYLIEIKTITDRPIFWVMGWRNGSKEALDEEQCPCEFIEIDSDLQNSGKVQQRINRFQYTRVVRTKYGNKDYPVYKLRLGGKDELVTISMVGNGDGSFSSLKAPKPAHIMQASLYAQHYNIKKILFLYIGKDIDPRSYAEEDLVNYPIRIFEHVVEELDIDMIKAKIQHIYGSVDKKELPPRPWDNPNAKGSECQWCPFSAHCWGKDLEQINSKLEKLKLTIISLEPGVMHLPSASLEKEFNEARPD